MAKERKEEFRTDSGIEVPAWIAADEGPQADGGLERVGIESELLGERRVEGEQRRIGDLVTLPVDAQLRQFAV